MASSERFVINEGNNYSVSFSLNEDTTGETISARLLPFGESGQGNSVGTVTGGLANEKITMLLNVKNYSPKNYYLEFWSDFGGDAQRLVVPRPETTIILKIKDRFGISN